MRRLIQTDNFAEFTAAVAEARSQGLHVEIHSSPAGYEAEAADGGAALLVPPTHRWECPNCDVKQVTHELRPHTEFHNCSGLRGLLAPMLPEGTKAKVYTVEREDYVGDEVVRLDDEGRPVMAAITEREDGQDCTVYAPTATLRSTG